jgi:hypothetical protein
MSGEAWRILWPDDDGSDGGNGELLLSAKMTVPQFYEHWFEPVVLVGERDAAISTRLLWRDTLKYWREKTDNPRLSECDGNDRLLAKFAEQMRSATYRRTKLPTGREYPLRPHTIRRHLLNAQWLLARAQEKGLIKKAPRMRVKRVKPQTKPAFTIEQVRAIFDTLGTFSRPTGLPVSTPDFWRGLLAFALISGVRKATFFALEWDWWIERSDGWWVDFPDHSVPKTDRGICVAIPDWLKRILFRWPRTGTQMLHNAGGKRGEPWSLSHWDECHDELQLAAGMTRPLPFQAWRRTLSQEMVRMGVVFGQNVASAALDHRDLQTTENFYAAAANMFRRTYPPLFYVAPDDGQKRLFD